MKNRKKAFFFVWTIAILLAPITVFANLKVVEISSPVFYLNVFQRIVGLIAFIMLSFQIVIGANMVYLTQKLGAWLYKFHITQGAIIYALVLAHPLSYLFLLAVATHKIDPFYIFTDFCLLCETKAELFYSLGRFSFWLITATVLAAKFRAWPPLRRNWRLIHFINYSIFIFIAIHARFVGSDASSFPFVVFYFIAVAVVAFVLTRRLYGVLLDVLRV
jgi:predicted ferric reductase